MKTSRRVTQIEDPVHTHLLLSKEAKRNLASLSKELNKPQSDIVNDLILEKVTNGKNSKQK